MKFSPIQHMKMARKLQAASTMPKVPNAPKLKQLANLFRGLARMSNAKAKMPKVDIPMSKRPAGVPEVSAKPQKPMAAPKMPKMPQMPKLPKK